eukprot:GHRR01002477.1.p1 GENE.GHRR01002477.1~~GHRR01002477.1.p1  ORF type:complete len:565 (+),score=247.49 GHRR01002477.1:469-2163(+)
MAVDNTLFKGCWRPEEDEALRKAVFMHGEKNWSIVARTFNTLMGRPANLGRAPKQCRSRYLQQLVPGIKTGEWTAEEEEILVDGHKQFGNQWTLIASMLPGRTETSVKNHYNCTARRKVPTNYSRMSTLQRYLASIGVITLAQTQNNIVRLPSLGSGYPSSSSSQFFHNHNPRAARSPAARHASPSSPAGSNQYGSYGVTEGQQVQHEQQQPFAEYGQCKQEELEHQAYQPQRAEQHSYDGVAAPADGDEEEYTAEGAAAGLLQLAQAAYVFHMEEDEYEQDTEEGVDGTEGRAQKLQGTDQGPQQQHKRHSVNSLHHKYWFKPNLQPVVHSNSEDSDRTAEEEEGSPMAEAELHQHLHPKRSSPSIALNAVLEASLSKRHKGIMWEQPAAAGGKLNGSLTAGSMSRLRPVLDVSGPTPGSPVQNHDVLFSPAGSLRDFSPAPAYASPALSSRGSLQPPAMASAAPQFVSNFVDHLASAFSGAVREGSSNATALSPSSLAAVARFMALTGVGSAQNYPASPPASRTDGAPMATIPDVQQQQMAVVAKLLAAFMQQQSVKPAGAW